MSEDIQDLKGAIAEAMKRRIPQFDYSWPFPEESQEELERREREESERLEGREGREEGEWLEGREEAQEVSFGGKGTEGIGDRNGGKQVAREMELKAKLMHTREREEEQDTMKKAGLDKGEGSVSYRNGTKVMKWSMTEGKKMKELKKKYAPRGMSYTLNRLDRHCRRCLRDVIFYNQIPYTGNYA